MACIKCGKTGKVRTQIAPAQLATGNNCNACGWNIKAIEQAAGVAGVPLWQCQNKACGAFYYKDSTPNPQEERRAKLKQTAQPALIPEPESPLPE